MLAVWVLLLLGTSLIVGAGAIQRPSLTFAFKPLIGAPKFLRIHIIVVLKEDTGNDVSAINSNSEASSYLDFVPIDPTNPDTLREMVKGKFVPGNVREIRSPGFDRSQPLVDHMIRGFNPSLNLYRNNCYHFAYHCWRNYQTFGEE
jgi:hypothetical protein